MSSRRGSVVAVSLWLVTLGLTFAFALAAIAGGTNLGDSSSALVGATFSTVGALIATKRRGNRVGWIFLGIGVSLAINGFSFTYADYLHANGDQHAWHWFAWAGTWSWQPGFLLLVPTLFLVFPDGQVEWRNGRRALVVCFVGFVLSMIGTIWNPADLPEAAGYRNPVGLEGWLDPLDYSFAIGSFLWLLPGALAAARGLYLRFRTSQGTERQQLKWFVWAGFATMVSYVGGSALWNSFGLTAGGIVALLGVPLLPVATGIAILKHRLYDIDVLINRALVYAALTALLAGAYIGLVFALQALLAPFTAESDLTIAASTLGVAALFRPVRARVQGFIDRRFYRRKFDAERTIADFSAHLRDQVELAAVFDQLVEVVRDTMQPAHVTLWMRPTGDR